LRLRRAFQSNAEKCSPRLRRKVLPRLRRKVRPRLRTLAAFRALPTPPAARYHPSRTHARSPTLQPRNPKNAAQKSQSSNFMAKRPPASPSGEAVRYQHGGDLSCDRRPSACESAPCRWRGKMQAEKQLAIERRQVEVEAERLKPQEAAIAYGMARSAPNFSLAPCALRRLVGVAVPPTLRRLKSRCVVAPPAIRHLTWTAVLDRKTLLLSGSNESLFAEHLASPLVLCPKSRTIDKLPPGP